MRLTDCEIGVSLHEGRPNVIRFPDGFIVPSVAIPQYMLRNFEIGTLYYGQEGVTVVTNRGGVIELLKYKAIKYGKYPNMYETNEFTQAQQARNKFVGHPGLKCYDSWTTSMDQCFQFGDFSSIPTDLTNPIVSTTAHTVFALFTQTSILLHSPGTKCENDPSWLHWYHSRLQVSMSSTSRWLRCITVSG